jgi:simple sugar transport system ATP-binding protein
MNPTRGLDVASTAFVRHSIKLEASESGMAVLLITSDLDEAMEMADTLHVLSRGRIQGTVSHDRSVSKIGLLMGGVDSAHREIE